ncbi:preprotein translocase subunit SecG [bacterium]|nr:preprotein translocase subunit SecG [bacterium]MBU1074331.1 preprotein translocase subunit SecG [bacterium]MBU1675011.1 preprotein translocase subunit SecG [bacterium]
MLYVFFMILHVIICLLLVVVVLMQSSKGGGLAGAFGGGGGLPQQMFGSRTMTTALHKMTVYLAVGFFLTSAILFILTADRSANRSVIGDALDEGTLTSDVTLPTSDASPLTETGTDAGVLEEPQGSAAEQDDGQ